MNTCRSGRRCRVVLCRTTPFPHQPDKEQNQEQAAVEQEEQKEWEVHKCKLDEFASSASQVQRRKAIEAE